MGDLQFQRNTIFGSLNCMFGIILCILGYTDFRTKPVVFHHFPSQVAKLSEHLGHAEMFAMLALSLRHEVWTIC